MDIVDGMVTIVYHDGEIIIYERKYQVESIANKTQLITEVKNEVDMLKARNTKTIALKTAFASSINQDIA